MQSQVQANRILDRRRLGLRDRETEVVIGYIGEPTIWHNQKLATIYPIPKIGDVFVCESVVDGKDYYYKVKEDKDGWWKLEWPD